MLWVVELTRSHIASLYFECIAKYGICWCKGSEVLVDVRARYSISFAQPKSQFQRDFPGTSGIENV